MNGGIAYIVPALLVIVVAGGVPARAQNLPANNAPMVFTGANGEALEDTIAFYEDDDNVIHYLVAEDNPNMEIGEKSIVINQNSGNGQQWRMTDSQGNATETTGGSADMSAVATNPASYSIHNHAITTRPGVIIKTDAQGMLEDSQIKDDDGDGKMDKADLDKDGEFETPLTWKPDGDGEKCWGDLDGDGKFETPFEDKDGDGVPETPMTEAGATAILDVVDQTSPWVKFTVVPEDTHAENVCSFEAIVPDNPDDYSPTDYYPANEKLALLKIEGPNYNPEIATEGEGAGPLAIECKVKAGMVKEEDKDKLGDMKEEYAVRVHNIYTITKSELDEVVEEGDLQGLDEGIYLPAKVRCTFKLEFDDNEKQDRIKQYMRGDYRLLVYKNGQTDPVVYENPPEFTFRAPNYPPEPGDPVYILEVEVTDGAAEYRKPSDDPDKIGGNSTTLRIPVNVYDLKVQVTTLEENSKKY